MREPTRILIDEAMSSSDDFDDFLDTRSPAEFALDHLVDAQNTPVLDDVQRAHIGTVYAKQGAFEANRLGAAWVARNVALHIEERFQDRPKSWRPLIYCWRGGQRSNGMATIMARVGWRVTVLEGGYRAYRRHVLESLVVRAPQLRWIVLAGRTGSAKSLILQALQRQGGQVLDLEKIACHRGSVLGELPDAPQPSQKWFDSQISHAMTQMDPQRPTFVESESKKVGRLHLPDHLLQAMRAAPCVHIEVAPKARALFLIEEYAHWTQNPEGLIEQLDCIAPLHSRERIKSWKDLIAQQAWEPFVESLLVEHYDPAYDRAMTNNFRELERGLSITLDQIDPVEVENVASRLLASYS